MNNKVGGARDQHLLTVTAGGQCGHLGSGHSGHTLSVVTKHGCVTSSHCVTARSVTRYRALNTDSPIMACLVLDLQWPHSVFTLSEMKTTLRDLLPDTVRCLNAGSAPVVTFTEMPEWCLY